MTSDWIPDIANRLRQDQIGIIPFETLWGITGRIRPALIHRIFDVKKRPITRPLLVIINSISQLDQLCLPLSHGQHACIDHYWPGPTTLILPKSAGVPDELTGGLPGIAIRLPNAPWLHDLITQVGEPIISTSANLHGIPAPLSPNDWDPTLIAALDFTVQPKVAMSGHPSHIVDLMVTPPRQLR